jgi:hypothetical protein
VPSGQGTRTSKPGNGATTDAAGVPPGAQARWERAGKPALTDTDRELLGLALNVERCAESAFNLVLRADTQAQVARFGRLEAAKLRELQRMRGMLLAWEGLRQQDGAPYADARMFFTEGLLFYAHVRRAPRPWLTTPEQEQHELRENARSLMTHLASYYPALADKMREPDRVELVCLAIASAASSAKRVPWKVIARTWDGIEALPQDEGAWRSAWNKHLGRRTRGAATKRT